jgi:predicted phage terminase large subunit-like protein
MLQVTPTSGRLRKPIYKQDFERLVVGGVATQARQNFWSYRKQIDPTLIEGWWQKHAAAHQQQFMLDMLLGKRPKLILKAPPQHGKSRLVHDFITWVAGHCPDWPTIYASYSDELGTTANLRIQRTLELPSYRTIFRGRTKMARMNSALEGQRNTTVLEYVGHKGSFRATTVNGQITGHGLSLGVVDDPIKGRAEASSKLIRDKTWNWLVDDFFSRFSDSAGMLMIMTRWHVDDPVGRWLDRFPETKVLSYAAIADVDDWSVVEGYRSPGEALFPELKPIDFLSERRRLSTAASWESLYQQQPIIAGGGTFPIEKFSRINAVEHSQIKKSVRYIDKAGTEDGGAYTAMVLMHMMKDGTFVIGDVKRGQWGALEREKNLLRTVENDAVALEFNYSIYVEQEPGSGGKESAENSVRMLRGYRAYADKVTGAKEVRAEPYAAQVQGGNVRLVVGGWNEPFLDEHEVYPNGPYKDQVDASAGAFNKLVSGSSYDSSYSGF